MSILLKRLAVSGALALATLLGLALVRVLPYSPARDALIDGLALPGAVVAMILYPGGVHGNGNVLGWVLVAAWSNAAVYCMIWFFLLTAVRVPGRK